jgi:hypothetical protein
MFFKRKPSTNPRDANWEAARKGKWVPEAVFNNSDEKMMRLTFVEAHGRQLPTLFMRYPETSFRTKITQSTFATLLIDVVTAFPFPIPFGFVMPVIFDDDQDPFWSFLTLTLFPLKSVYGVPHVYLSESNPLAPRRLLESCARDKKCGLVILNDRHKVLKSEILSLDQWDRDRPNEIVEMMQFLDSRNVMKDFAEGQAAADVLTRFSCFIVKRPDGQIMLLPKNRWPHVSDTYIYPIRVVHDRLLDRRAKTETNKPIRFDVFISHAHSESAFALSLRNWLLSVWPTMRVFLSEPEKRGEYESNPAYFLDHAQASKLMLLLVSETSLERRIVMSEVGLQAGRPILPVLIGGVSREHLEDYAADQMFVSIDASRAVDLSSGDGWTTLGKEVARLCGLAVPKRFPHSPKIQQTTALDNDRDANAEYVGWWEKVVQKVIRRQTEEEASKLLDAMLDAAEGAKIPATSIALMRRFDVQSKLIVFLMHSEDEMLWRAVVGKLPALLTPRLINKVLLHVNNFSGPEAELARLKRLALFLHEAIASEGAS